VCIYEEGCRVVGALLRVIRGSCDLEYGALADPVLTNDRNDWKLELDRLSAPSTETTNLNPLKKLRPQPTLKLVANSRDFANVHSIP